MENQSSEKQIILEVKNIYMEFPGVKALTDFSFNLYNGEVHALIGENGAGKSTFIKVLSGAKIPNSGEIIIGREKHNSLTPHQARRLGIQTVYQEDILVPSITAAENIFLGVESSNSKKAFINYKQIFTEAKELAKLIGIKLKVDEIYERLSPSDQQFVKILKALAQKPKVLILDEPTQAFNKNDIGLVIEMVKKISQEGVGVIYIAHDLEEIIEVADRVTVLRDGVKINTHDKKTDIFDPNSLAKEMIGRSVDLFYKKKESSVGDYVFEVQGLKLTPKSTPVSFKVREGEILGVAGLKGSGRSEIARAIFGALRKYEGKIFYKGKDITPNSPIQAVRSGIALLTESKKIDGLFMGQPVSHNITAVGLDNIGRFFLNLNKEKRYSGDFVKKLNIKTPSLEREVKFLSGGNQQKVVIAKWLFKGINVLIVDEPTHGIDVNAKTEVYELFTELAASGKSIIMISSEMPELISLSDRIIVVRNFEISRELLKDEINEENILSGFMGGK
ncbi:MAG: sugar ABC transporter ATP-binding protein [Actinomycetota bacterium]|jgi:ribose transport system ATP-binding protein|nr:sugar ABC transporter ATP-binding protein [Actinomycetota bacterium]